MATGQPFMRSTASCSSLENLRSMPRSFCIRSAAGKSLSCTHAAVQSDGSFHLTTFATRDGAPVGDFALTVTWPGPRIKGQGEDEPGPDRLQHRYANPKKPAASVHVGTETTELATIDLKPVEEKPGEQPARRRTSNHSVATVLAIASSGWLAIAASFLQDLFRIDRSNSQQDYVCDIPMLRYE